MIIVRRALPTDIALFRSIRLEALKDSPGAFGSTYEAASMRELESWSDQLKSTVSGDLRNTQFAFQDNRCIGLGALYRAPESRTGEIIMMWVSPSSRSAGAGTMIVGRLLSWARDIQLDEVRLTVTDSNRRAIAFYQKCGLSLTGEIEDVDLERNLKGVRMAIEVT